VSWAPDGQKIGAGSSDGSIWVWQIGYETGRVSDWVLGWIVLLSGVDARESPDERPPLNVLTMYEKGYQEGWKAF